MQNLKEGMTTVIEKLMAENVELTQRFNEAVRALLHAAVAAAVSACACPPHSARTIFPTCRSQPHELTITCMQSHDAAQIKQQVSASGLPSPSSTGVQVSCVIAQCARTRFHNGLGIMHAQPQQRRLACV